MLSHIMPKFAYRIFFTYNGIFKIAYAKIMPHMQKCAYMPHISAYAITFFSIFLVQRCFKTAKYFGGKRLSVITIRRCIKSKMSKLCRKGLLMIMIVILDHSNFHMLEFCRKICRIYVAYEHIHRIYVLHILPNFAYFALKSLACFKKIFRYKPASLIENLKHKCNRPRCREMCRNRPVETFALQQYFHLKLLGV